MKHVFIAGLLLLLHINVFAQQKKLSWNDQFIIDKTGKPFPVADTLMTITGKAYHFPSAKKPAFVYLSTKSCVPCAFEFPLYLEACAQHPGFDFVYFTTDENMAAIKKKFGKRLKLPNIYVISRPYDFFYDHQLMLGFPTKYFINSRNIVQTVQLGGYTVKEKVWGEWNPVLAQLQ